MSAEAKAVLERRAGRQEGAEDVTGTVLKAVADVMLERPDDALKELSNPQVGNQLDAPIWRAIAYARQGKWPEAQAGFKNVDSAIAALPIEFQRMALRDALRTAIEVRDFNGADRIVNELDTIGVPPEMEPSVAVLAGRLKEALGRNDGRARQLPRRRGFARPARRRARRACARSCCATPIGDMPRKDVINALETLTTIWRGDETEAEGLKLLAHLYTEDNRYRAAFHVMRVALLVHPNSDFTRAIQDEAAVTFDSLFLGGKGDALPPIEALGLFYDYPRSHPDRTARRRDDPPARRPAGGGRSARPGRRIAPAPGRSPPARRRARAGRDPSRRHLSHEPQAGARARHLAGDAHGGAVQRAARPAPAAWRRARCPTPAATTWRWN